jgi:cell division protein ZapA (FtsZ GTPase activity inhibitor)
MGLVNLKFRSHNVQLECDNEERAVELSKKLNERIERFSGSKNANDTKLVYLTALLLQDEMETIAQELNSAEAKLEHEFESNNNILSDTLNYIAEYLENLAERLKKQ